VRFVIIGGGPAGNTAATVAASLGAEVTMIEREIIGGAAHLHDCIPSKAMVATGNELADLARANTMGLDAGGKLDVPALRRRISGMEETLRDGVTSLLESQGVRLLRGTGRLVGAYAVEATTESGVEQLEADAILLATGSRPRVPEWVTIDGERILTTRQAYPPPEIPEHLVVIGSGVTGVEFTHMFSALGSQVSLIVSRQQVLPTKDPEVAAVLENEFIRRGVKLLKGARAVSVGREDDKVFIACDDGRASRCHRGGVAGRGRRRDHARGEPDERRGDALCRLSVGRRQPGLARRAGAERRRSRPARAPAHGGRGARRRAHRGGEF